MCPFLNPIRVPCQSLHAFSSRNFCLGLGVIGLGARASPSCCYDWSSLIVNPMYPALDSQSFLNWFRPCLPIPLKVHVTPPTSSSDVGFRRTCNKPGLALTGERSLSLLLAAATNWPHPAPGNICSYKAVRLPEALSRSAGQVPPCAAGGAGRLAGTFLSRPDSCRQ